MHWECTKNSQEDAVSTGNLEQGCYLHIDLLSTNIFRNITFYKSRLAFCFMPKKGEGDICVETLFQMAFYSVSPSNTLLFSPKNHWNWNLARDTEVIFFTHSSNLTKL